MSYRQFNNGKGDSLKFEDTYLGYSDEEEDAFNDATFGGNVDLNQDFNFGGDSTSSAPAPQTINYAQAAATKPAAALPLNDDPLKPIESLWGGSAPSLQSGASASAPGQPLSLDEIEAQLTTGGTASAPISQQQQKPQFQQGPPQPFVQPPGFYNYPPGFLPPQPQQGVSGPAPQGLQGPPGFPPQFNLSQVPPQQFAQLPPQVQQQLLFQHQQQQQFQQQQFQQQQPQQPVPQQQQQLPPQQQQQPQSQPEQPQQQFEQQPQHQTQPEQPQFHEQHPQRKADLSEFPVLGSEEANSLRHQRHDHQHQHQHQQQNQQHQQQSRQQPNHHPQNNNRRYNNQYGSQHHDNFNELPEEEKQRLIRRQQKVQRILQFTGIMNPRDKDFVTRVQLSQIVTEDPYNEDFYFQVYRLLKSGEQNTNNNSIAQAYLDFSGHRLGGRYQRADLALQRMQQQVQKAVTVAKSKPKSAQFAKEGALGKVSLLSGRMPRKQLEIIGKKPELPEVSKGGRKATLLQLEDVYQQVLSLESQEREQKELDTELLWESLKLFDDSQQLNPFIQLLSYEKGLKIFPRLFHFLDRQQKLTIITLLFANLSLIKIISKSSFKNHENDEIPSDIQKTIELFQLVVLKPVILFLSYEAVLSEIIGLLTILIEHNNVSFLSTSKLGISLLTILLSRAEIIKQEQTVSSEDLSHWSNAYDKLFSSLETKLPLIFPSSKLEKFDDSYIWQFLASLSLSGKINHQRIIVDEIRDEIFGSIKNAKESDTADKIKIITNLNLFLNVIGLSATEDEIVELK